MRLAIIVPVLGQNEMANVCVRQLLENIVDVSTRIIVADNGGDFELVTPDPRVSVVRMLDADSKAVNMGVYPVFQYAFGITDEDLLAFFHSDLMVADRGFDARIVSRFMLNKKLGLMGFIGSNEIDYHGGRGGGTTSNFQGATYTASDPTEMHVSFPPMLGWVGSPAEAHGRRNLGYSKAAVVDGCAMIVRRAAWEQIGFREDFPPHHFYDRLISTQMLEHKWEIEVLGVACDHISGQTVAREERYHDLAKEWCLKNGVAMTHNWDDAIYREAEKRWLYEFRQVKGIIPVSV